MATLFWLFAYCKQFCLVFTCKFNVSSTLWPQPVVVAAPACSSHNYAAHWATPAGDASLLLPLPAYCFATRVASATLASRLSCRQAVSVALWLGDWPKYCRVCARLLNDTSHEFPWVIFGWNWNWVSIRVKCVTLYRWHASI